MSTPRSFWISLFFLMICISDSAYAQWKKISQFRDQVTTIYFLDQIGHSEIGYLGLYNGELWRSQDAGNSWQQVFTDPFALMISDITFKDSLTGWFVNFTGGRAGIAYIYQTTDAGNTWQQTTTSGSLFSSIYCQPQSKMLFYSEWSTGGFFSTDDGISWTQFSNRTPLNGYAFTDQLDGIVSFAGVSSSTVLTTTTGGSSWQLQTIIPSACWQPAAKPGTATFFMFSEYTHSLTRSDDLGQSWNTVSTLDVPIGGRGGLEFTGCLRINSCGEFFTQSTSTGFFSSSDEGISWQSIAGPSNEADTRFWINGKNVFAGDFKGGLWMYRSKPSILTTQTGVTDLLSQDCSGIDTLILLNVLTECAQEVDSIAVVSLNGSSAFSLGTEGVIPRSFLKRDSVLVMYRPVGLSNDTATLFLRFFFGGIETDTILSFLGTSRVQSPFAPELSYDLGARQALVQPGKDTTVNFSLSADVPAASAFDSLSFDLGFTPDMLKLDDTKAATGWNITATELRPGVWNFHFYNPLHLGITANQALAFFHFSSYLNRDSISQVTVSSGQVFYDPKRPKGCPIESFPQDDSIAIAAADICGDSSLRQFLLTGKAVTRIVSIRPNPASSEIEVEVESPTMQNAEVLIYDELGIRQFGKNYTLQGKTRLDLSTGSLAAGKYHLIIRSMRGSVTSEFIKIN
ncbi:MAG: hypothetical protein Q8919_03575 [Bacteroidota bacterium]|nr:hypothetical protein [Bacteroidota bacterium]